MARRCWKHSLQKTGRPCVGRNGTVVSFPHCEQLVLVSERTGPELPPPLDSARLALQALQRFGSFLKPLSAKNICSPAVKTNSAPHSAHFRTLSWYSMEAFPLRPRRRGTCRICTRVGPNASPGSREPGWGSWGLRAFLLPSTSVRYLDRGLNHGSGAPSNGLNWARRSGP